MWSLASKYNFQWHILLFLVSHFGKNHKLLRFFPTRCDLWVAIFQTVTDLTVCHRRINSIEKIVQMTDSHRSIFSQKSLLDVSLEIAKRNRVVFWGETKDILVPRPIGCCHIQGWEKLVPSDTKMLRLVDVQENP